MENHNRLAAFLIGFFICIGLLGMGLMLKESVSDFKAYERTVVVKGLAEKEMTANVVIWPIQFVDAGSDLSKLYTSLEEKAEKIKQFLLQSGFTQEEISISSPAMVDRSAQNYGSGHTQEFRYSASQIVTVYSSKIELARKAMGSLSQLGKQGIVFTSESYQSQVDYLFTELNEIKPAMVEEATIKAREVAQKFAQDSDSTLGKIRKANQGLFEIRERDKNNPHIKVIRVVSTVEYYLTD